jgi:hypothetical protein
VVLRVGIVVSDTDRTANRRFAVSVHVQRESEPWSERPPVLFAAFFAGEIRIAREEETQRGSPEHRALDSSRAALFAE